MSELVFLKLGGSLITDKDSPQTTRPEVIRRVVKEIGQALARDPGLKILIGHGSGSFGHIPGRRYNTRAGVSTAEQWNGFVEVWRAARRLNQVMVEACLDGGLPVVAFPPSSSVATHDRQIKTWHLEPLVNALEHGLVPLIHGDVVFDQTIGGTILSTEDLFAFLAPRLRPTRVLLAGVEKGVWKDYPHQVELAELITPASVESIRDGLAGSGSIDVTGGMREKVLLLLRIVQAAPGCTGSIFSGMIPGNIEKSLGGLHAGTLVRED